MPCTCGGWDCPECMGGYVHEPNHQKYTEKWKDEVALNYCYKHYGFIKKNKIMKIPKCEDQEIGYMAIKYEAGGYNYFRVDFIL